MRSFHGPDCGVNGCEREVGHIGDHRRVGQAATPHIGRPRTEAGLHLVEDMLSADPERWVSPWHLARVVLAIEDESRSAVVGEVRRAVQILALGPNPSRSRLLDPDDVYAVLDVAEARP